MKTLCLLIMYFLLIPEVTAQTPDDVPVMTLNEYLGFVKFHHPVAKQARLTLNMAQAELMKARGGFDPNITIDYDRKQFEGSGYYDILNGSFKIPVWFGIDIKAGFERNDGVYLNPQRTVPEDGLYSAGISVPLGQGLFINERMATLKKAKLLQERTAVARDILINQILYDAVIAYVDWFNAYNEMQIYENVLRNAETRFKGIRQRALVGDIAAIDTVEAGIIVQNRALSLEQARIKLLKAMLEASNFLWLNNVPMELQPGIRPDPLLLEHIDNTLNINNEMPENFRLEDHPKIQSLRFKLQALEIDRRLKTEKLKPKLNVEYNFITADAGQFNSLNTNDYKVGLSFEMPLLLRKERGDLKLARLKLQDAQFDYDLETLRLNNTITGSYQELASFEEQLTRINAIVESYEKLVSAEERKFGFGESSVFLVNARERSLIEARLKQNELQTRFIKQKAALLRTLVALY